jgi:hypothetical protein
MTEIIIIVVLVSFCNLPNACLVTNDVRQIKISISMVVYRWQDQKACGWWCIILACNSKHVT